MTAHVPFSYLIGLNPHKLTKEESHFLEADLLSKIYSELINFFKKDYIEYFQIMKFKIGEEAKMLEKDFIKIIIGDILSSNEYTLEGIAYYTQTPFEVICELAAGINTNPSSSLLIEIIRLHKIVRPAIYIELEKKLRLEYLKL